MRRCKKGNEMSDTKDKTGKQEIYSIQVIRVAACLMILMFHSGVPYTEFFWGPIEVFFVLSSYFLSNRLLYVEQKDVHIGREFFKRVKRLYLPYFLVIIRAVLEAFFTKHVIYIKDMFFHLGGANSILDGKSRKIGIISFYSTYMDLVY